MKKLFDFSNVGEKIKRTGLILFWVEFIVFVLAGIVSGFLVVSIGAPVISIFLLAPVGAVVGYCFAWCSSCMIIGFGVLVEKAEKGDNINDNNRKNSNERYSVRCPECNVGMTIPYGMEKVNCPKCNAQFEVEF